MPVNRVNALVGSEAHLGSASQNRRGNLALRDPAPYSHEAEGDTQENQSHGSARLTTFPLIVLK